MPTATEIPERVERIDFLPATYHQARERKKKRIFRRTVLLLFFALVALGTVRQRHVRTQMEAERDRKRAEVESMLAKLDDAAQLRLRIKSLDHEANLITHLRTRLAPTRIVATVVGALPEHVTLNELRLGRETVAVESAGPRPAAPRTSRGQTPAEREPAEADLQTLLELEPRQVAFVSLRGIAPDDVSISLFLSQLKRAGLFSDVRLLFTDRFVYREHELRTFSMHLRVHAPGRAKASVRSAPESTSPDATPRLLEAARREFDSGRLR